MFGKLLCFQSSLHIIICCIFKLLYNLLYIVVNEYGSMQPLNIVLMCVAICFSVDTALT